MRIADPIDLTNGTKQRAFEIKNDGSVMILCDDNVVRRVHPSVVAAFGSGQITAGVWALACHYMQNPGMKIILPPPA